MSIELTSEECEVLRRWGKDPDRIAAACHQRPNWLRDLLDIDEQMRQTRLSFLNEYQQEKSNG